MHSGRHAWGGVAGACDAWQGVCMAGAACMEGDIHGRRACMMEGACVVGGMHGGGMLGGGCVWQRGMCGRGGGHCSGQYASYWNAFLFLLYIYIKSSQV